jgi:hypothetical protein
MKTKITMLFALLTMATTIIFAQGGGQHMTVPERVKATMDKITPALALNPQQVSSTDSVFTDYYTTIGKAMQDARASGERPDRSVFEKMRDDRDAKLKNIFTPDQYTKFKNEVEATLRPQRNPQGQNT